MLNEIGLGGRKPLSCEYVSDRSKLMYLSTVAAKWLMEWRGVVVIQERGDTGVSTSGGCRYARGDT